MTRGEGKAQEGSSTDRSAQSSRARDGRAPMSLAHKQALADGREASRHVRAYIDALEKNRPKRGRKLDKEAVKRRVALIDENLKTAGGFERLNLLVDKQALLGKLDGAEATNDLSELREKFVRHAKAYGARRGISYATWRSVGVPPGDLKAAGIARGHR